MKQLKAWVGDIIEVGIGIISLGVLAQVLFGKSVPFVGAVVDNLTSLISGLGENGLVGLIALGVIVYLFKRKNDE
jgi:hypothetical protein|tara:strand:- start:87 stop:311 length:225 start_codon:yes stop_codon:yes gene_type:complete